MRFRPFQTFSTVSEPSAARESATDLPDDIQLGLTVLHPKNDDDDEKVLVDIITIHGLSGHPKKTWTNSKSGHYWPLKSLPHDIPFSRIMTFGYSTNTKLLGNSTAIISDIAKALLSNLINKRRTEKQKARPIIFVAHSLGGIVLKEFLHIASNTGNDEMAGCVCGILFLGTPHKGSDLASFLNVLNVVTKSLFRRPPDVIVQDLSTNSRHLLELDQLLRFKLGKIEIYSFYELRPMGSLKTPVVERHSALLNLPSEIEQIGLDADHRQMCKPIDRNDFIYETIAQRIINIMNRQIDREKFSNELMKMTNNFAVRQMEQISLLATIQTDRKPNEAFPAILMASFSETRSTEFNIQPNALVDVLKDLPRPKAKEYLGGLRKLFERAESLNNMLRFAERQNEQLKAEVIKMSFDAEQKADKQRIADLMAENERLKNQLRVMRLAGPIPTVAVVSREPIDVVRHSRRDSFEIERMIEGDRDGPHIFQYEGIGGSDELREEQSIYEEAKHATTPVSAAAVMCAIAASNDGSRHRERRTDRSRRQRSQASETSLRLISSQRGDFVQEEADRYYRESMIARKAVFDEDSSPERSVVDRWRDNGTQLFPAVIPSEFVESENSPRESIFDDPVGHVVIRSNIADGGGMMVNYPMNTWTPIFKEKNPSAARERPALNLISPTPIPSREPSLSPPEEETTRKFEREVSKPDANDITELDGEGIHTAPIKNSVTWCENESYKFQVESLDDERQDTSVHTEGNEEPPFPHPKPTGPRIGQKPAGFADDEEFAATLAAGLKDTGFGPDIVIEDPVYHRRGDSPSGVQDDIFERTGCEPGVKDVHGYPHVSETEEAWAPTLSKKNRKMRKKKKKKSYAFSAWEADMDRLEDAPFRELNKEVEMQAENTETMLGIAEEKLVQTRIKSEDILNSLRIALTHGQELFESLGSEGAINSDQDSVNGSDGETEYSYEDEGNEK
ncbi:Fc.00g026340.m01.CDS01 [Cosmosporella sp. VM-42]